MAITELGTGQAAYALLRAEYGHIDALSFASVLVDKRGHADLLACLIVQWCLDWYRPTKNGEPRVRGRLFMDSAGLARQWNVSPEMFKRSRARVSASGLITFATQRHQCIVLVQWEAVYAALDGAKTHSLNLDGAKTHSLNRLDGAKTHSLNRLDGAKTHHIPTLDTSLKGTPPSDGSAVTPPDPEREEGGDEQELEQSSGAVPVQPSPLPSSPSLGREAPAASLSERVEAMLKRGRDAGRSCDGKWSEEAHRAVSEALERGETIQDLERAWAHYLQNVCDTSRGKGAATATDLGHWLRDVGLDGKPRTGYSATIAELRARDERRRKDDEAAAARMAETEDVSRWRKPESEERAKSNRTRVRTICETVGVDPPDGLDEMTGDDLNRAMAEATRLLNRRVRRGRA